MESNDEYESVRIGKLRSGMRIWARRVGIGDHVALAEPTAEGAELVTINRVVQTFNDSIKVVTDIGFVPCSAQTTFQVVKE